MKKVVWLIMLALPLVAMEEEQVTLQSQDGEDFKVEVRIAKQSETIKNLIEDAGIESAIPLPTINGKTLAKIVEMLKWIDAHPNQTIDMQKLTEEELLSMLLAVNYLDIKHLFNPLINACADRIFNVDLDKLSNEKTYTQYKQNFLDQIPKYLQQSIINRNVCRFMSQHTLKPISSFKLDGGMMRSMAFSFDGSRLVTATNADARLWSCAASEDPQPLTIFEVKGGVAASAFSYDNSKIVTVSNKGIIEIWSSEPSENPQPLKTIAQTPLVQAVAFSPDGLRVATFSVDGMIRVWNASLEGAAAPLAKFRAGPLVKTIVFSPDGSKIIVGTLNGTIKIWNTLAQENEQPLATFDISSRVRAITFSNDGSKIATGLRMGTVSLWRRADLEKPQLLVTFDMANTINQIVVKSDCSQLVTASNNKTGELIDVIIWEAPLFNKLDLVSAQIIIYVIKNNIKKFSDLPKYLQQSLNEYAKQLLFPK